MKIFTTALMATLALCSADIGLLQQGYNYQHQQPLGFSGGQQQPLIMQIVTGPVHHQQASPAQLQQQLARLPFTQPQPQPQPQNQYLPSFQQQLPQQQQLQQQQLPVPPVLHQITQASRFQPGSGAALPMPSSLSGLHPANTNTVRRPRPRVKIPKKPLISKSFFIHSAPEETEEELQDELSELAQQPRKHYNVIFVKTPSQTSKAAALNFAKTLNEEKTVVYVLAKKTSAADLQDALAQSPQRINKPEVFFIKYRTPEEAANAQRQIQSQYDSLGGSSTISDEGVAPVTSVVGSLDPPEEEDEPQQQSGEQQNQFDDQSSSSVSTLAQNINGMGQQYLPPSQY